MKRKGRLFKKEGGVSEVLGSILVLLITVLLFSTVFYYVSTMPTPNPRIYAQFDATLNVEQDASGNYYLNITVKNVGGEALVDWRTMFIVVIDFTAKQHMLSEGNLTAQPFDSDGKFSQGESFYYLSSWDGFVYNDKDAIRALDISVTLYDKSSGNIIWSSKLQGRTNMPPILIRLTSNPSPIVLGHTAAIKAMIFDPDSSDDVSTYKVGIDFTLSNISQAIQNDQNSGINPSYVPLTYSENNVFTKVLFFQDIVSLDVKQPYLVKVYIDDGKGNNVSTMAYLFLSRGTEVSGPDLYINSELITLSNYNPTRGEDIIVTVTIQNRGGTAAKFRLAAWDSSDRYSDDLLIITNRGNPQPENDFYSVAAGGQATFSFIWREAAAKYIDNNGEEKLIEGNVVGTHTLKIKIEEIYPEEDKNAMYPNEGEIKLTILPKILFVDADQAIEGTNQDTSRYYEYILDTCNYHYDIKKVMGNVPVPVDYNYLEQYDVVIWETGYYGDSSSESTSAISLAQMKVLKSYYDTGKSLWIISQEISPTVLSNGAAFGLSGNVGTFDGNISGVYNPDIDLTLENGDIITASLINRSGSSNNDKVIYFDSLPSDYHSLIRNNTNNYILGVYSNNSQEGKFVYFGFELSRIDRYYRQNFIAYRVLNWLAGLTGRVGSDVAVDDMTIEPSSPLYMQPVNITVVVSNNGEAPISTQVMLKIDDERSPDITTQNPVTTSAIPPNGGYVKVNFTWVPSSPGRHIITVYVDPYNLIKETNEENNMLNTNIIDNEVYVHFSTLILYNSTSLPSDVSTLEAGLDYLGYKYNVTNVENTVPEGYKEGTYFQRYNLIIWVVEEQSDIGEGDIEAIKNAAASQTGPNINFMFIGEAISDILEARPGLSEEFNVEKDQATAFSERSVLYGVNNPQSPTNGLAYIIQPHSTIYGLKPIIDNGFVKALFYNRLAITQIDEMEETYLIKYAAIPSEGYGVLTTSSSGGKAAFLPFNLEDLVGLYGLKYDITSKLTPYVPAVQAKAEIMYHLFHRFGEKDEDPELAVYPPDIEIKYGGQMDLPIIVGRSYMLRATVYNYGTTGVSAVVRFYDDLEWIGGQTVYVPGSGSAQVEIQWTPMFAGSARHISVIVDPLNEIRETAWREGPYKGKEIFNYNNEAILTKRVYYFWDNMEYGSENWFHQATVMDINGESPLDFLNRKDVSTNVIGQWDWSISGSTNSDGNYERDVNVFYSNDTRISNFTLGAYHSALNAFWMPEAPRENIRAPIDVIFVIDTSGSMLAAVPGANVGDVNGDGYSNTRVDVAIQAALDALNVMSDNDRVAIFAFSSADPIKVMDFTYVTAEDLNSNGKPDIQDIQEKLESLGAGGGTPMYDTSAAAVEYMDNYGRDEAVKGILFMTDGLSNADEDNYKYARGRGYYEIETAPIQDYTDGNGLLKIPYSVLAISIAPDAWDGRLFPIGNSSTGNVSMALFEDDPIAIQQVFSMFVQLLVQQSTGGIRASNIMANPSESTTNLRETITISGLGAVVFSDGFRIYASEGDTGTPDDADTPGFLGRWHQHGFTIVSTNDDNYYYKAQSGGWKDRYWVAQTDVDGAYMEHMIYPGDVLKYHYPGSYVIKGAEIRFWVGRLLYASYPSATINVYANGQLISTLNNVLSSGRERYYTIPIPVSIQPLGVYDINITVVNTNGPIGIDDVMVVYYIDYSPPITSTSSGGSVPTDYSSVIDMNVNYSYFITPSVNVEGAKKAILTFWTKYWMTQGTNGGIMYLWGSNDATTWTWDKNHRYYLMPTQSYTGNLKPEPFENGNVIGQNGPVINGNQNGLEDATYTGSGTNGLPLWCFNGRSGDGTFGWDYIEVDLTHYLELSNFKYIRIVFMLVQFGGIAPENGWNPAMGWYLDDVKIMITSDGQKDLWHLQNFGGTGDTQAHSGNYSWVYADNNGDIPPGVDSSLVTKQIDLSTARSVNLLFWIRFNLNPAAGVPPATIRVEVSDDNGMTWQSITYGVRIGWGSSGYGGISGTPDNGQANHYDWVGSTTLYRINCDLSGWAGRTILLRFRVATNATINPDTGQPYPTWDPEHSNDPHGVFLDDVFVYGESYTVPISPNSLWQ